MRKLLPILGIGSAALVGAGILALLLADPRHLGLANSEPEGGAEPLELRLAEGPFADEAASTESIEQGAQSAHPIAQQAQAWGIERCANEIALIAQFLTRNAAFTARSMHGPHDADGEIFSATIVARDEEDGAQSLSTMTVAPVSAGRCNVVYETTVHFPAECATIHQARFGNFDRTIEIGNLGRAFTTEGGEGQLYMLATAGGCLVKKTQSLY